MESITSQVYDIAFYNLLAYGAYSIGSLLYRRFKHGRTVERKRADLEERIEKVQSLLKDFKLSSDLEKLLPGASISQIHKLLVEGKLTCVELVKFFTKHSWERTKGLNIVVDYMFPESFDLAKQRDEQLKKLLASKTPLPPLFGIPISLKDVLNVEGYDTLMGAAQNCFNPHKKTGLIVELLLDAGAVPFVRTSCPQLLLINETNNWINGRAKNPWNQERTTGGSSGGEGGLVAVGGSVIGIGSDGGGSVRIPACFCGLYGIRPTAKRTTVMGHLPPSGENTPPHIYSCVGPLGKNTEDCIRTMEAFLNNKRLAEGDPLLPPMEWNKPVIEEYSKKKLRVGVIKKYEVIDSDQLFNTCPSSDRIIDETVTVLKKNGHFVMELEVDPKLIKDLLFVFFAYPPLTQHCSHESSEKGAADQWGENHPRVFLPQHRDLHASDAQASLGQTPGVYRREKTV